jgi:hypothetical protein
MPSPRLADRSPLRPTSRIGSPGLGGCWPRAVANGGVAPGLKGWSSCSSQGRVTLTAPRPRWSSVDRRSALNRWADVTLALPAVPSRSAGPGDDARHALAARGNRDTPNLAARCINPVRQEPLSSRTVACCGPCPPDDGGAHRGAEEPPPAPACRSRSAPSATRAARVTAPDRPGRRRPRPPPRRPRPDRRGGRPRTALRGRV